MARAQTPQIFDFGTSVLKRPMKIIVSINETQFPFKQIFRSDLNLLSVKVS